MPFDRRVQAEFRSGTKIVGTKIESLRERKAHTAANRFVATTACGFTRFGSGSQIAERFRASRDKAESCRRCRPFCLPAHEILIGIGSPDIDEGGALGDRNLGDNSFYGNRLADMIRGGCCGNRAGPGSDQRFGTLGAKRAADDTHENTACNNRECEQKRVLHCPVAYDFRTRLWRRPAYTPLSNSMQFASLRGVSPNQ